MPQHPPAELAFRVDAAFDGYALHSADAAGTSRETPVTLPVTMKLYAGDAPASPQIGRAHV